MSPTWENPEAVVGRLWIRLAVAVGVILVVAAASRAQQSGSTKNDDPNPSPQAALSGTWKLNRDESDDPREKLRSAIQDRNQNGNPGGMGRRGGMGGGWASPASAAGAGGWDGPTAVQAKVPAPTRSVLDFSIWSKRPIKSASL